MLDRKQEQQAAQGSTAIQAGGNVTVTYNGLSYSEVRDVALDVFKSNFYRLAGLAQDTAKARAEEVTEKFLSKLEKEHPLGLNKAQDPDFQYALFTAQREYARNGDQNLGDLLVDLLVDRSKHEQRDILQIVLNESLITAPKLTDNQLAVLSIVFLLRYTQNTAVGNHTLLGEYLDRHVADLVPRLPRNLATFQHLEFTGCGAIAVTELQLESLFAIHYQGLFMHGFDPKEIADRGISAGSDPTLFVPCLNNPSNLQVKALNKEQLEQYLQAKGISPEDRVKIVQLFDAGKMDETEIRQKCIEIRPYMSDLFEAWSGSAMKSLTLTSVGIALGHANLKRLVGEFSDLSIWIN